MNPTSLSPAALSPLSPAEPVLILGAGLMGRLLAWQLARAGHPVELLEAAPADSAGGAARVAAAMLAPLAESAITEPPVVRMGQHGLQRWPELLATLPAPVFFQQNGTLVVWHRQDSAEAQRFSGLLQQTVRQVPGLPAAQSLPSARLAELEPALAGRFHQGLYLPHEGQLDNRGLLQVLLHHLPDLGVDCRFGQAIDHEAACARQRQRGGWLIDCRGLGARPDWSALRGVRGEVARVHAPGVTLQRPTRLLHPRYPIYIAPKPDHLFVIGATEIESDDLGPASVRSTLELLSAAYAVHPGFAEGRILELCTQCRPTLPNNLPALRLVAERHLQVNGLYRHGFMIAPAVLDSVLQALQGDWGLAQHFALWPSSSAPSTAV